MSDPSIVALALSGELDDALHTADEWTAMKDTDNDRIVFVASDVDSQEDVRSAARAAIRGLTDE